MKMIGILTPATATTRPIVAVSVYAGATLEMPSTVPPSNPTELADRPFSIWGTWWTTGPSPCSAAGPLSLSDMFHLAIVHRADQSGRLTVNEARTVG